MAANEEPAEITELKCAKCGQEVSGPNADSVKATMARHRKKAHSLLKARGK